MMDDKQRVALIAAASDARRRAYAPYSNYQVGAALLTSTGDVFVGCNVENGSFGLTICAERVAFSTAVAAGQREFEALAIATPDGRFPCGACRQFAAEFCDDLLILLIRADRHAQVAEVRLRELLPGKFSLPKPRV